MIRQSPRLHLLALLPLASAAAQARPDTTRLCLAPTSIETTVGTAADAVNAVRETFTTYLTGPSLGVLPLNARHEQQVAELLPVERAYLLEPSDEDVRLDQHVLPAPGDVGRDSKRVPDWIHPQVSL